jgi:hypothetical protein
MNLGEKIDTLYATRQMRLDLEKQAEELKRFEKALEDELVEDLEGISIASAKGSKASFSISKSITPNVEDWDAIHAFMFEKEDASILQKRLSTTVWREYFDDEIIIPGTEAFEITKASLRKI